MKLTHLTVSLAQIDSPSSSMSRMRKEGLRQLFLSAHNRSSNRANIGLKALTGQHHNTQKKKKQERQNSRNAGQGIFPMHRTKGKRKQHPPHQVWTVPAEKTTHVSDNPREGAETLKKKGIPRKAKKCPGKKKIVAPAPGRYFHRKGGNGAELGWRCVYGLMRREKRIFFFF